MTPTDEAVVVPEQYLQFVKAIEPHLTLLRTSLATPPPLGEPLHKLADVSALLDSTIIERLANSVTSFGSSVFAAKHACDATVLAEAETFGKAIRSYLANFDVVRSRPFPGGFESGHPLLIAIIEKPLRNLLASLETVQEAVVHPMEHVAKHGSFNLNLYIDFGVADEVAAWQAWCESVNAHVASDDCYFSSPASQKHKKRSWLWTLVGAYVGYELFFDND